jgi:hypothetical protein
MAKDRGKMNDARIITETIYTSLDKAAMVAANIIVHHVSLDGKIEYGIAIYGNNLDNKFCLVQTRLGTTRWVIADWTIKQCPDRYNFKAYVHSHPTNPYRMLANELSAGDYNISFYKPCPMYLVTNLGARGTLIKFTPPDPPLNVDIPRGDKLAKFEIVSRTLRRGDGATVGRLEETSITDAERIIDGRINWKNLSPREILWGANTTNTITFSRIHLRVEQELIDDEIRELINNSNIRSQLEIFNNVWDSVFYRDKEWIASTKSRLSPPRGTDIEDWNKLDTLRKEKKTIDANGQGTMYLLDDGRQTAANGRHDIRNIIRRVVIQNDVTKIGGTKIFAIFPNLESINVEGNNPEYSSYDGVLFDKSKNILIRYPTAKQGVYTIPATVTQFGTEAFFGCANLTSIMVATDNIYYSSMDCVIFSKDGKMLVKYLPGKDGDSYTIPDRVTHIRDYAFDGCTKLTSVTISSGVDNVEPNVFNDCTNLASIRVVDDNPNFSSVDGVLFNKDRTELIRYTISEKKDYLIPPGVTAIRAGAFRDCIGLKSVIIPDGVITIGESAFYRCFGLISVTIPSSVETIGGLAFGHTNLNSVTVRSSNPREIVSGALFPNVNIHRINLSVPVGSVDTYKGTVGWKDFKNINETEN